MAKYYVELTCTASGIGRERFESEFHDIAKALFALPDGAGASFSSAPRHRTLTFGFMISAPRKDAAIRKGISLARTAIHEVGGNTAGWAEPVEFDRVVRTERELQQA